MSESVGSQPTVRIIFSLKMEKNLPKGLYMGQWCAPERMSYNRKKSIHTSTFDSRGSFLQTLSE